MRIITNEFKARAEAAQNSPVELIDFYLGAQDMCDEQTLHYSIHSKTIDFYNLDGNTQTYLPGRLSRSQVAHNAGMRQDSVTVQFDNVGDRFQTYFWKESRNMLDKRLVIRQIFGDLTDSLSHAVSIISGVVDHVVISERTCQIKVVSMLGYSGFQSGAVVDRVCPISIFASSRCAQGVSAALLTQETMDVVDTGSTTTSIKVKTLAQTDDYWNTGKIEFTSGANDGTVRKIIDWDQATKTLTLDYSISAVPAEDDAVRVSRDCDRTLKMCRERFLEVGTNGNMANFRGKNTVVRTLNP